MTGCDHATDACLVTEGGAMEGRRCTHPNMNNRASCKPKPKRECCDQFCVLWAVIPSDHCFCALARQLVHGAPKCFADDAKKSCADDPLFVKSVDRCFFVGGSVNHFATNTIGSKQATGHFVHLWVELAGESPVTVVFGQTTLLGPRTVPGLVTLLHPNWQCSPRIAPNFLRPLPNL